MTEPIRTGLFFTLEPRSSGHSDPMARKRPLKNQLEGGAPSPPTLGAKPASAQTTVGGYNGYNGDCVA